MNVTNQASEHKVLEGLGDWELDAGSVCLGQLLGEGATSEVYHGDWNGTQVAVKQINRSVSRMSSKAREALCRELAILQSVNHRNVVRMLGVVPYRPVQIITELCHGGSVFGLLHESPEVQLCWAQKLKICKDTAKAMCYLHSFEPQILHRDLKSLNLLLMDHVLSASDEPHVKLSDFGLARLKDASTCVFMTVEVGTCHWTAPEVLRGGSYDEKVDLYSFAMIIFEVACRMVPFDEIEDANDIRRRVQNGERPSTDLLPADCPQTLRSLMTLCWNQDPALRPDFQHVRKYLGMVGEELEKRCPIE